MHLSNASISHSLGAALDVAGSEKAKTAANPTIEAVPMVFIVAPFHRQSSMARAIDT
jgi:hypothetical protein